MAKPEDNSQSIIVDTSVLLATAFNEKYADWAEINLVTNVGDLKMSVVTLYEALIVVRKRRPDMLQEFVERLFVIHSIEFVPVSLKMSILASALHEKYPINFGDSFVLALAQEYKCPILTLDSDFKKTGHQIIMPE